MWLRDTAYLLSRIIKSISQGMHTVAGVVLAAMMLLTFSDVLLRYVFNRPISGSTELTEYMMAIVVSFGLAYCTILKGHVQIELVFSRLRPRVQAILDAITCFISVLLLSLITWQYISYIPTVFYRGQVSVTLKIPLYPFIGVVLLAMAMFTVAFLSRFIESLSEAVRKWNHSL